MFFLLYIKLRYKSSVIYKFFEQFFRKQFRYKQIHTYARFNVKYMQEYYKERTVLVNINMRHAMNIYWVDFFTKCQGSLEGRTFSDNCDWEMKRTDQGRALTLNID